MSIEGMLCAGTEFRSPVWDRAKNEMEIVRHPIGGKSNVNISITYYIVMRDIECVDGIPAGVVISRLIGIVESIVTALEAEALRLGLV